MTPRDWELLSEWLDGTLGGEERVAFERRLATETELASAARRLRALSSAASKLGPSVEDAAAAARLNSSSRAWGITGLVVLLGVVVAGAMLLHQPAPAVREAVTLAPAAPSMEPLQPLPHVTASPDAGAAMIHSLDAAVLAPLAAIVVATAAGPSAAEAPPPVASSPRDASTGTKPVSLAIGGKLRIGAPLASVRAVPTGVVELIDRGEWTSVEGRKPGQVTIQTSSTDGGTGETTEVRVEAIVSPEAPVVVQVGRSTTLLTPRRVRWSTGDPTVALVTEGASVLELRGGRVGSTTVEAWFEDGTARKWPVQVEPRSAGNVRLGLGAQKVLTLPSVGAVTVTPGGVVTARAIGNKQVLLGGQGEGVATVEVSQVDLPPLVYRVTVVRPEAPGVDETKRLPAQSVGVLVPVVVAVTDLPENTVVTLKMLSQRSIPAQLVTPSQVKPDSASSIVNQRLVVPLKAGESVLWSHFGMTNPPTQ